MPRLENWAIVIHRDATIYDAPESVRCFSGDVYDHPNHADGTRVQTSLITEVLTDGRVRTEQTIYELGAIRPDYEAAFPGARERLFRSDVQRLNEIIPSQLRVPAEPWEYLLQVLRLLSYHPDWNLDTLCAAVFKSSWFVKKVLGFPINDTEPLHAQAVKATEQMMLALKARQ